ncbi:exosortase B [uncultured Aquabacterium sp.]|uniref:exosortase B n=1 Tax=uncultured Aquabacterium sp. TaxID=158753 RepID=UPI0025DB1C2A|nr:exosortase B [uncultured Aquabacterium sp.]
MTAPTLPHTPWHAAAQLHRWAPALAGLALLIMYFPTYRALDEFIWGVVGQGHGPVMLALALWLAWQRYPQLTALRARPATVPGLLILITGGLMYVVGRSQDVLFLDAVSQIPVVMGVLLLLWGWQGLKTMWFPIFFLIFLVPVPGSIVDVVTAPLKMGVSYVAEHILYAIGYPIARMGVTLHIGPYQLLVADACAGLNSIFALEAIGVFYMSVVQHASRARNILLATLIIPISFTSNVLRVIALVLITYYFGDEVGQGFVHDFAGILLFLVATALTVGADSLLGLFFDRQRPRKERTA